MEKIDTKTHPWRQKNDVRLKAQYIGRGTKDYTPNATYDIKIFGTHSYPVAMKLFNDQSTKSFMGYKMVQHFFRDWTNIEVVTLSD